MTAGEADVGSRTASAAGDYERVVRAWAMYDWANSAFAVVVLTAVFPVYYRTLVLNAGGSPADATAYWAYTTSVSLLAVAAVGPLLGAVADLANRRKRFLGAAVLLGVSGTASLAFLGPNGFLLGSLAFALGNTGFAAGNIFYEALLPHVARREDTDRVSARGYALGYLGGGLLLALNALWLARPTWFWMPDRDFALRVCFASVAVWWLVFAWPLFRNVTEPSARSDQGRSISRLMIGGIQRLAGTLRQIRRYRQAGLFLVAFWTYNDGIGTIIKLAAAYGDEIGVPHDRMLIALILTQLIGFPSTLAFGSLALRLGAKRAIFAGLAVYTLITVAGFFMTSAFHFYVLAIAVGLVQGGTQALSRSLFASMVPKLQSAEFFGFFSTGEKLAGIVGPAVFGMIGQLTGSSRWGILSVAALFVAGAALLARVDVEAGRRLARMVERDARGRKGAVY
ncbi:MAG TPA: MFS transporter [candidate division Zixibacteria bacterium]|nr:MFS transporter [candidate division Zixibacteria bacterium]